MRSLEAQRFDAVVADPPYSSGGLHRGDHASSIEPIHQLAHQAPVS